MVTSALVTVIILICGHGEAEPTEDCRDFMVNCAVRTNGEIKQEIVRECADKARLKFGPPLHTKPVLNKRNP